MKMIPFGRIMDENCHWCRSKFKTALWAVPFRTSRMLWTTRHVQKTLQRGCFVHSVFVWHYTVFCWTTAFVTWLVCSSSTISSQTETSPRQVQRRTVYHPLFALLCALAGRQRIAPLLATCLSLQSTHKESATAALKGPPDALTAGEPGSVLCCLQALEAQANFHGSATESIYT